MPAQAGGVQRPDAAAGAPNPQHLLALAYSFVQEVYPELLRRPSTAVPFWMTWLDGFSGYSRRRFRDLLELLHRRKSELRTLCWWSSFWAMFLPLFLLLVRLLFKVRIADRFLVSLLFFCPLASFLLWGGRSPVRAGCVDGMEQAAAGSLGKHWPRSYRRLWIAPGGLAALLEDDDAFALLLQRFLNEHQVPYSLPLYGPDGRYLFAAPEKVPVLAKALLRAVGKGRDNELFVLLVDLLELDDYLEPMLRRGEGGAGAASSGDTPLSLAAGTGFAAIVATAKANGRQPRSTIGTN